jgi:hypothetical protein
VRNSPYGARTCGNTGRAIGGFSDLISEYFTLTKDSIRDRANFHHIHNAARARFAADVDENHGLHSGRNLLRKYLALHAPLRTSKKEL